MENSEYLNANQTDSTLAMTTLLVSTFAFDFNR
jgi:hypothetical protein